MLSYRKLAMCVLGRPLHTGGGGIDLPRPASQRAAAFILTAAMLTTLAAPAFAKTWHIEDGDITVKAGETKGTNKVSQGANQEVEDTDTIITNRETKASSNTVTIEAEKKDDKVEVTLKDVNIDTSSRNKAAVSVTGEGDTNIKLNGDNALKSDIYRSGIYGRGSLTISGGENDSLTAQGGSGADGIYSSGSLTISGGTVTANGDDGGRGIYSRGGVTISGGTVEAAGGNGDYSGGDGIYSSDIDLSGSLELTAKAGKGNNSNGRALSQNGSELDLNAIKDKLGPGAKVIATDADGKVIDQVPIPALWSRKSLLSPQESSSSSGGDSAAPSAPVSSLPGPDCHRQGRPAHPPTRAPRAAIPSPSASDGSQPPSASRWPPCVSCGLRASRPSPSRPSSAPPPSRWTSCWPWAARTPKSFSPTTSVLPRSRWAARPCKAPLFPDDFCGTLIAEIYKNRGKVTYGWRPSYSFHLF